MKRLISLLLAAVLLLGTFAAAPTEVHAARELKASDNIIELIKYFEGFVAKAPAADAGELTEEQKQAAIAEYLAKQAAENKADNKEDQASE